MPTANPADFVERVRIIAQNSGAVEAEVYAEVSTINEIRIRDRQVSLLQQSTITGFGLRVVRDSKVGFMYTTDFEPADVNELVLRTIALAAQATPQDENRLQDQPLPAQGLLDIYDDSVAKLTIADLIPIARTIEQAGLGADKRILTVKDARAGTSAQQIYFTNTYVKYQTYVATTCWLACTAVATDGTARREGSFTDRKRNQADITPPVRVGQMAASRALAKLGAKSVPSTTAPVIFEAEAATGFLRGLFPAFNGTNVIEGRSYLGTRKNQQVASPLITIVDEGILRRGLGSMPFDGEGTQTRKTPVVDGGTLAHFLETCYTSRRSGEPATGNAVRNYETLPNVGPTNFYIARGDTRLDMMIKGVKRGLYVTEAAGFGVDTVAGHYSQQATGFWIENGALTTPVEGVTIAGSLDDMLMGVDAVGKDLEYRDVFASPSLLFRQLTIAGS
jgi:PmbA protein